MVHRDPHPATYPISIKALITLRNKLLVLKNHRDEWDLPGGRIEYEESPESCVAREVLEETQLRVRVGGTLVTGVRRTVAAPEPVFIVVYRCHPLTEDEPRLSCEHTEYRLCTPAELAHLELNEIYRQAVRLAM